MDFVFNAVDVDVDAMDCVEKEGECESDVDENPNEASLCCCSWSATIDFLLIMFYQWQIMCYYFFFCHYYHFNLDVDAESALFLFMRHYDSFEVFWLTYKKILVRDWWKINVYKEHNFDARSKVNTQNICSNLVSLTVEKSRKIHALVLFRMEARL